MSNLHAASVRIARAVHQGTPQEEADARRDLAAEKIAKAIDRALAVAPPISTAQVKPVGSPAGRPVMARRGVAADYPSKKRLTEAEKNDLLAHGPKTSYFSPWAERGILLVRLTNHGYGYIHVYSQQGSFQYDFAAWDSQEGLNWGLEDLWERHPDRDACQGVIYFQPDESLRLYMEIEADEEEDKPRSAS